MMETPHIINLSDFNIQFNALSKLLGVKSLFFHTAIDAMEDGSIDTINAFTFFKDFGGEEFEHFLLDPNDKFNLREKIQTLIAENILYYTVACRDTTDLRDIHASGVIDFENFQIKMISCEGSEYISRAQEFIITDYSTPSYIPSYSGIYLLDEIHEMANSIEDKPEKNIYIQTIKI